ncbi:MAG TPA: PrsW family glutamic-type intramembrane protease [Anaerolineales bacterium]
MSNTEPPGLTTRPSLQWPAILQLVFSSLAAVLLLGTAVIIVIVNLVQYLTPGSATTDLTQTFMVAASLAFAGVLVIPSAWYSWKSISSTETGAQPKPERRGFGLILTLIVVVLVPGALLLGNWAAQNTRIDWLLLPPLNILATGLPALWLVYLGTHGLPLGSFRRRWGVFASGLVLGPLIIIVLELLALVGMGILAIVWLMINPNTSSQLTDLVIHLENSSGNPDAILRIMLPYLLNPGLLLIVFAFISVIVPVIEESLKPLGVWFLAGQKLSPAQGFVYGVLSGAGFGLFENLGNTSSGGESWALLASSRISTLLLHCFTAGMVGWALVSAWSQRRYLRLGLCYILAVFIHGLWNGMAVLGAVTTLQGLSDVSIPTSLQQIGSFSAWGIVVLGAIVLVLYIGFNAALRRNLPAMHPPTAGQTQSPSSEINPSSPPQSGEGSQSSESALQDQPTKGNPSITTETNL